MKILTNKYIHKTIIHLPSNKNAKVGGGGIGGKGLVVGLIGGGELIDRRALKSDQTPDYSQAKPYRNYQQTIGAKPPITCRETPDYSRSDLRESKSIR